MTNETTILSINSEGELQDGTTIEALFGATLSYLEGCQFNQPTRENSLTITKLEEAILWHGKGVNDNT